MTYKQIEASREIRLWIGQVIVPAAAATVMIMGNPQAREFVSDKWKAVKRKVKTATGKKGS